jgi:2-polyprenyl-6-methoxyphenol hydroxylase-like FAD-dependent oxidoreductase
MKITIIGGSIGGLIAGIALKKAGHEVNIYERSASEMQGRGAGLVIQSSLMDYMINNGISSQKLFGVPAMERQILNDHGNAEYRYENDTAFSSWSYLWKQLKVYFPAENYHYGHQLEYVSQNDEIVQAAFSNGTTVYADLLVGADGYNSIVREHLFPGISPSYAGYVAYRGLIPEAELNEYEVAFFSNKFTLYPYTNSHLLAYMVPGNNGELEKGGRQLNWVWYLNKNTEEFNDIMTDKNGVIRDYSVPATFLSKESITDLYTRAKTELPAILSKRVLQTTNPFVQGIVDMQVPKMYKGRIVILGDAASLVRPHTASGTAKAFEDGVALASELALHKSLENALREWNELEMRHAADLISYGKRLARGSGLGVN